MQVQMSAISCRVDPVVASARTLTFLHVRQKTSGVVLRCGAPLPRTRGSADCERDIRDRPSCAALRLGRHLYPGLSRSILRFCAGYTRQPVREGLLTRAINACCSFVTPQLGNQAVHVVAQLR